MTKRQNEQTPCPGDGTTRRQSWQRRLPGGVVAAGTVARRSAAAEARMPCRQNEVSPRGLHSCMCLLAAHLNIAAQHAWACMGMRCSCRLRTDVTRGGQHHGHGGQPPRERHARTARPGHINDAAASAHAHGRRQNFPAQFLVSKRPCSVTSPRRPLQIH